MDATSASASAAFGETADVEITILVDNCADLLVRSTDTVKRFTDAPLLAEHGFAAMVNLKAAGLRILWDAGVTGNGLIENMARMKIRPASIDKIALSHGHGDHTAALTNVIKAMDLLAKPKKWERDATAEDMLQWAKGRHVSLIVHPAAFRERWGTQKDGSRYGPVLPPPRAEWEAAGAQIILAEGPSQLGPGCWTTGAVARQSFETAGISSKRLYRAGDSFLPDLVEDDQAMVINVRDKGLLILAGCAHSGILNTVNYARQISGVNAVWAVIGGFHLAPATGADIQRTVDGMKAFSPKLISPSHCTGLTAIAQFAAQMPDAFVQSVVGTTYAF